MLYASIYSRKRYPFLSYSQFLYSESSNLPIRHWAFVHLHPMHYEIRLLSLSVAPLKATISLTRLHPCYSAYQSSVSVDAISVFSRYAQPSYSSTNFLNCSPEIGALQLIGTSAGPTWRQRSWRSLHKHPPLATICGTSFRKWLASAFVELHLRLFPFILCFLCRLEKKEVQSLRNVVNDFCK